ncbi:hypothetical protein D3C78_1620460 [compost metagenome]
MLLLAGIFGLYGIAIGFIALTIHLVNLRSFGVPYFTPVAPQIPSDLKDVFIRAPRWANQYGLFFTFGRNKQEIPAGQRGGRKKEEASREKKSRYLFRIMDEHSFINRLLGPKRIE